VSAPALLYKVEPTYPEEARKKHIQGVVVLYVEVDPAGRAANPRVVRGLGYGLDDFGLNPRKKLRFQVGIYRASRIKSRVPIRAICADIVRAARKIEPKEVQRWSVVVDGANGGHRAANGGHSDG